MTTGVAGDFAWQESRAGRCLRNLALAAISDHVFTTRQLEFHDDSFERDSARLASAFDVETGSVVWVRQVHGRAVVAVEPGSAVEGRPEADAIVSSDPGRVIAVRVADCVPVLVADRHRRVVAAIHAGWRGTCAGVIEAAVSAMADAGANRQDLVAAVGPSIGPCCYQVDDRVRGAFLGVTPDAASWFTEDGPGHWRLDLWAAAADQLQASGLPADSIHVSRICTAENLEDCFSYRKEGPATGRLAAAIRLAPR